MRFYAEYNIMEIDEDNYSYALVGSNTCLLYTSVFHRQVCDHPGTVHVVGDTLLRIILHHRHMLVSRGMKHVIRTMVP